MTAQFQDVQYRQNADDPTTFFYIPGTPSPEMTPAGVPAASLVGTGDGGFFQLGVHWDLTQKQIEDLQEFLRQQFPDLTSAPILRLESLTVDDVKLVLQMPDRSSTVLATSTSAGFPPFTALFNVALDAPRFAQASMALSGRENVMKVQYDISGQSAVSCTATISGDVRQDVQEMDAAADIDACRARIESAISDGRIHLTVSDGDVSARVRDKAVETAKDRAAKLLQRMLAATDPDLDAAHLLASATLRDMRPVKLVREADVGRWFTSGNTVKLFMAATPPPAHKGTLNRTFKLGFEAKDFPIAFVQLASGKVKEAFRPPAFNPVTMSVEGEKPVTVTTNYTDGGPAYQVQVDAGDEAPLTAQQLGFCLISVDGSGRKIGR